MNDNSSVRKNKKSRRIAVLQRELDRIQKKEVKVSKAAKRNRDFMLMEHLEEKIPEKVHIALEKAFCKAFTIIFEKGTSIIEKSYNKERIGEDYDIQNYAVKVRGTRRELGWIKRSAQISGTGNMAIAAAEGIGFGVLGIGLPDIVVFIGVLLKGIYEMALHYGFDYCVLGERMLILKMMEAAISKGEEWERLNAIVDEYMKYDTISGCSDFDIKIQMERTAGAFSTDMLLLKFVQGLPLVGILGGVGNPIYYHKVMQYVGMKYQKRYLQILMADIKEEGI